MRKFIKEYRVELIALLLVLLGVFLLVEQFNIRLTVRESIEQLITYVPQFLTSSQEVFLSYLSRFTLSDLLGWVLIISTTIFVAWRFRYRFLRSSTWRSTTCPKCGSPLNRIPRKRIHYLLGKTVLPHGRYYQCSNKDCSWTGLRHRHRKQRSDPGIKQYPPEGNLPFL